MEVLVYIDVICYMCFIDLYCTEFFFFFFFFLYCTELSITVYCIKCTMNH